ncbi:hypothetical protein FRC02_011505 [Tulasnella sp. 418]|nr:hypothetical protein FRC02_011505 [Tulasnella sp. 418]
MATSDRFSDLYRISNAEINSMRRIFKERHHQPKKKVPATTTRPLKISEAHSSRLALVQNPTFSAEPFSGEADMGSASSSSSTNSEGDHSTDFEDFNEVTDCPTSESQANEDERLKTCITEGILTSPKSESGPSITPPIEANTASGGSTSAPVIEEIGLPFLSSGTTLCSGQTR